MAGISYQNGMAGEQQGFSAKKAGKRSLFSETLAGISTLTQWIPGNEFH